VRPDAVLVPATGAPRPAASPAPSGTASAPSFLDALSAAGPPQSPPPAPRDPGEGVRPRGGDAPPPPSPEADPRAQARARALAQARAQAAARAARGHPREPAATDASRGPDGAADAARGAAEDGPGRAGRRAGSDEAEAPSARDAATATGDARDARARDAAGAPRRARDGGGLASPDGTTADGTAADARPGAARSARGAAHGAGHASARTGAARPGGGSATGRDAPPGSDGQADGGAAGATGAAVADAARSIGERLRAGAAEAAPPGAPAPSALAAAPPTAAGGEAPAPAETPPTSYTVTVPVHEPRFADAFAERISWLLREGLQVAELTLHPQELGPVRIELALDGDAATIGVVAAQAETRGAIEQALPRLRELLAQQGVQLGGASVDGGAQRQAGDGSRAPARRGEAREAGIGRVGANGIDPGVPAPPAVRRGRVDLFA
jgi:flagellar hook-length control protein FliK